MQEKNSLLSYLQNTILSWLEQSIFSYNLVVTVEICFEATLIHGQLPSELIFAQSVLRKMRFSSLAYGVVCIKKRLTYTTNDVLRSRHECKFDVFALDLHRPTRLANCKF